MDFDGILFKKEYYTQHPGIPISCKEPNTGCLKIKWKRLKVVNLSNILCRQVYNKRNYNNITI